MSHQLHRKRRCEAEQYKYAGFNSNVSIDDAEISIIELFRSDIEATGLSQLSDQLTLIVSKSLHRYISETKCNLGRLKTSQQAADLAEIMKSDDKLTRSLIEAIFNQITLGSEGILNNIVYSPSGCTGYSICSACPYYLKSHICLYASRYFEQDDANHLEKVFEDHFKLSSSLIIVRLVFNLFHYIISEIGEGIEILVKYKCLLEDVQLIMSLYQLMNPTGSEIQKQEDKLYEILTEDRIPIDDKEKEYLYSILSQVFDDITTSKLPYVRGMQKAMAAIKAEMSKGYLDTDYYLSMKATSQTQPGKERRKSLLNSVVERDSLLSFAETKAFDEFVGYSSHYLLETDTIDRPIKTIMITNPGKFKMRGIHISENAIQDRCNYIHRCIKKGLKVMKSDCSQRQQEGRDFAKSLTLRWFLASQEDKPGIYCLDFSNATDTMDQEFQNKILEFTMGSQVSNYWGLLSRTPKTFCFRDRDDVEYLQKTGQPQGLLGSFDAFSLAHHFMMLMVMKMCHFERYNSEEFYRILGDDSILYSIESEHDLEERGISVLESYKRVCLLANFKVNDDKGIYTFADSNRALASFAKVDFMNGTVFSPTPVRLAMSYSTSKAGPEYGHLGVALWRVTVGYPNSLEFLESVMNHFQDGKWIVNVLENGYFQTLSENLPNKNNLTSSQRGRINYALSAAILDSTMSQILMPDKELAWDNPMRPRHSFDDLFKELPERELELIPMEHKIFKVLEENNRVDKCISETLAFNDLDTRCIRILCELIERKISFDADDGLVELINFATTYEILQQACKNPLVDVSQIFPDASLPLSHLLNEMKLGLMTRGLTKKPTRSAYILKEAYTLYRKIGSALGELPEDKELIGLDNPSFDITLNA